MCIPVNIAVFIKQALIDTSVPISKYYVFCVFIAKLYFCILAMFDPYIVDFP